MTYTSGDKVRCIKTIYAGTLPSILVGNTGEVLANAGPGFPFPIIVFWDKSVMSKQPYKCYVTEDEIELVDKRPEQTYVEPVSGG